MSWWVSIEIDTGGEYPATVHECGNLTYNVAGILHDALGAEFRTLHGQPCSSSTSTLQRAIDAMRGDPARFEAMNPPNGWGSAPATLEFLEGMLSACQSHPKAQIRIN